MAPYAVNRSILVGAAVGLVGPATQTLYAALFEAGGALALLWGASLLCASALLMIAAVRRVVRSHLARHLRVLLWTSLFVIVTWSCVVLGVLLHPGSNIPGLLGLIAAPFYWLSSVTLV